MSSAGSKLRAERDANHACNTKDNETSPEQRDHADVTTVWNFNSVPADASNSTGSLLPSLGTGLATTLGGVSSAFGSDTAGYRDISLEFELRHSNTSSRCVQVQ